jgi:CO/xanthine dehydrogenase FAD-binding subunit
VALEMDGDQVRRARVVAGGVGTKPWQLMQVEERYWADH